jgi:hypothetical protein
MLLCKWGEVGASGWSGDDDLGVDQVWVIKRACVRAGCAGRLEDGGSGRGLMGLFIRRGCAHTLYAGGV